MWISSTLKTTSLIILMLSVLSSCNKDRKFEKELSGQWTIESYEFTNPNGLSYYYPAEGGITFNKETENSGTYTLDYTYVSGTDTIHESESGEYNFNYDDTEHYDMYRTKNGISDTLKNARIILITKTDLRTEMGEVSGRRTFVFNK